MSLSALWLRQDCPGARSEDRVEQLVSASKIRTSGSSAALILSGHRWAWPVTTA
jgi:hypothetical protein